jgi:DNA-binding HxlR family transcriptional regulator
MGVDIPPMPERGSLDAALRRVGDRWTLLVVAALLDGPRRFGELQEAVPSPAPTPIGPSGWNTS